MRQISSSALNKLNQQYGCEPLFVVGVNWNGTTIYYADKTIYDAYGNPIIFGKILNISNIESILNLQGNQTSVSIDVTLDDSDGYFLNLMNNVDIHLRPCYLYQYFEGLSTGDMFELFEGHIVSEIEWNDINKSIKFTMMTWFQNYEAGFSPEEGDVKDLREDLVGKPWPMGFGTVIRCPATRITDIPVGVTTEPMGVHDYWLDSQLARLNSSDFDYSGIALFYFLAALQAYNSEDFETGDQMTELGNQALIAEADKEAKKQEIQSILTDQLFYDKKSTYVLTDYPINLTGLFEVGGNWLVGSINKVRNRQGLAHFKFEYIYHNFVSFSDKPSKQIIEDQTSITNDVNSSQFPTASLNTQINTFYPLLEGPITRGVNDFVYIEAGSQVKYLGNYPVKYVVNIIPSKIIHVYANRTFEGYTRRMKVPKSYYKEITVIAQSSRTPDGRRFKCTGIELFRPLSTLFNQHWDDEIFVTYESTVGDDFQSIIRYIVSTFSLYSVDDTSLDAIPAFRLNFAITELKDVLTLIREICYQCKVAVTLKNGKFYFVYLPLKNLSGIDISLSDLIEGSLNYTVTRTEDIITKMIGHWKIDYSDPKGPNLIVLRYNTNKYGTLEQEEDYYCFNVQKAVEASMSFWLYRKGNTWKQLKIDVPIKFLMLENYDIITLTSDFCSEYGINGGNATPAVILDVNYIASDYKISLLLELPIQLGSNVVDDKYWPSGSWVWMGNEVSIIYNNIIPPKWWDGISYTPISQLGPLAINLFGDQNANTGNVGVTDVQFDQAHQSLNIPNEWNFDMTTQNPPNNGFDKNNPTPVLGSYGGTLGDYIAPKIVPQETISRIDIKAPTVPPPQWSHSYKDPTAPTQSSATTSQPTVFPGYVKSGSGNTYTVTIYPKGLSSNISSDVQATVLAIDSRDTIPTGYPVFVLQLNVTVSQDKGSVPQYYIQPPIWGA